ncbi:hypothetical protein CupriaWKF_01995 [Cupriavidus sp. WKF15]|nr:hypothetical protein [Cupriavidus sp. WKF15]WER46385.1 hypothetical protein CupriaWKF_01995 [Cupriavidus sp. WKF15]
MATKYTNECGDARAVPASAALAVFRRQGARAGAQPAALAGSS